MHPETNPSTCGVLVGLLAPIRPHSKTQDPVSPLPPQTGLPAPPNTTLAAMSGTCPVGPTVSARLSPVMLLTVGVMVPIHPANIHVGNKISRKGEKENPSCRDSQGYFFMYIFDIFSPNLFFLINKNINVECVVLFKNF